MKLYEIYMKRHLYEIHPETGYHREFYENGCNSNWFKFRDLLLCWILRGGRTTEITRNSYSNGSRSII